MAVVAREPLEIGLCPSASAQPQRREVQPGGPALGALGQTGHRLLIKREPFHLHQQRGRLIEREAEISGPELGQLTSDPKRPEPERRLRACADDQMQRARSTIEQELDQRVAGRSVMT